MKTKRSATVASVLFALIVGLGSQPVNAMERYAFATAGQGGTYHLLGTAVAQVINNNSDMIQLTATSTSGANANMPMIDSGQMGFGMGASFSDLAAYEGNDPFSQAFSHLRVIMVGYVNPGTFVVRADSDIHEIEDFRGKRVSMPMGGASRTIMTGLLSAYGLEADEDYTVVPINFGQAVEAMQNGNIDVSMQWAAPPSPAVMQMAELFPIRLIPVENQEAIEAVRESMGAVPYTYEPGIYRGVDTPTPSIAMLQSFLAHQDVPNEHVQEFIRIVIENNDALRAAHHIAAELTLQNAARALDYPIPAHPGAVEFFEAMGAD